MSTQQNDTSTNPSDGNHELRVSTGPLLDVQLHRIGTRVPPFWPERPAVWFAQLEAQFMISGIKADDTKFYYVIGQLEHQYAAEIEDIILNPPQQNKYEKLKTELTKRLSASKDKNIKQLLMHEEMGDRKPSQFLRHMQHLAGMEIPVDFLKTIWTSRLPNNIQTAIVSQPTMTLEALADLADRVHDIAPSSPQVASTSSSIPVSPLDELTKQVSALTQKVENLSTKYNQGNRRDRSRPRSQQRGRSPAMRSESSYRNYPVCYYHKRFGSRADKCIKPCDYESGNSTGGR